MSWVALCLVMVYTRNTLGEGNPTEQTKQITIIMELIKRYSSRIARRVVKQGALPSVMDQAKVEKLVTGTNSSIESLHGNENQEESNPGPLDTPSQQIRTKRKRMKWTREEYKLVLYAYALEKPSETNCTTRT